MSDGWTDRKERSLVNFLVNSSRGTMFIKSIDASSMVKMSRSDSRSDPNGGFEPGLWRETVMELIDLLFIRAELAPVGIQTISIITKIIYIYKRTTT